MKKLFVLLILIGSIVITVLLYQYRPEPKRRPPVQNLSVVETQLLKPQDYPVYYETFGTVNPSREVNIVAEVEGVVIAKNSELLPGGMIPAGDILAKIDPRQYHLILEDRKAAVTIAENDIELEQGQQIIARQEWELLKDELQATDKGKSLVLRQPQLENVRARLAAAQSKLEQAQLDISKSTLVAPFNALVLDNFIEKAQFVSRNKVIARLISTDEFWIYLYIPESLLPHLKIPDTGVTGGSLVTIFPASDGIERPPRTGHILRLLPEVNPDTRLAGLLVSVSDPLNLQSNENGTTFKLLVGSYIKAHVDCGVIKDAISIPQGALYNQNSVWLYEDGTLKRQQVSIVWQRKNDVLISTDLSGSHLVVSRLLNPLDGMKVRSVSSAGPPPGKSRKGKKSK